MTHPMTPEQIEELRALLAKATAGPWDYHGGTATYGITANGNRIVGNDTDVRSSALSGAAFADTQVSGRQVLSPGNAGFFDQHDAAMACAAVNALPALLTLSEEASRLREALKRLGSMEAFVIARATTPEDAELLARIDYARAAPKPPGEK